MVAIVFDDAGGSLAAVEEIIAIGRPVAVAVLPHCHLLATELERETAAQPADAPTGGTVARRSTGERET